MLSVPTILFADWFEGREVDPKHYHQIMDLKEVQEKMNDYQEEYNLELKSGKLYHYSYL